MEQVCRLNFKNLSLTTKRHSNFNYYCAACGNHLFVSDAKFASSCGWPSFYDAIPGTVVLTPDDSHGMSRTEVTCATCGSHLGHVFTGEGLGTPTDQRYCINSLSLQFDPDK